MKRRVSIQTAQRLEGDVAHDFVAACLAVARPGAASSTWFEAAVESLEWAWGEAPALWAPSLAIDLLLLASGEKLSAGLWPLPPAVHDAVRRYEDSVLARLVSDPRWARLSESVVATPAALRPTLAGVVATQLLSRLGVHGGVSVSPAAVRRFRKLAGGEVIEQGRAALRRVEVADPICTGLTELAKEARNTRLLLSDAELLVAENVEALKGLGPRVALAQLALVSQALESQLPVRMRGRIDVGDAPTALEEASAFPVGGFSSVTTTGAIENLVSSELMYLDGSEARRPDLFDVRFVEGELLYYARDESVAVRRKSHLAFVLDPSLRAARLKAAGESYQQVVLALGTIAATLRRLATWFDSQALTFELIAPGTEETRLDDEARVLALALKGYQQKGQLTLGTAATSARAVEAVRSRFGRQGRALVYAVGWPEGLSAVAPEVIVSVASKPELVWHQRPERLPNRSELGEAESVWGALTSQLVHGLLRR
jgi:hypothetical protein